jgi:AraC-like DNA-binding protein
MEHKKRKHKPQGVLGKTAIIILLSIPLLLLIFPAIDFATRTHTVFPAEDIRTDIFAFDDKAFNGNSEIERFSHTSGELNLKYRLRPGALFPMVFINFALGISDKPFDLSGFESVSLSIEEATIKSILLYVQTFVPGISRPGLENVLTMRPSQYTLLLTPGVANYTVEFKKLITEAWWFASQKINPDSIPQEEFKKVINFTIMLNQDGSDSVLDKHEHIVIKRLAFTKSMSPVNCAILIGLVLFYAGLGFLRLVKIIRNYLLKIPEQKPVQVTSYYEQDLTRIREFLEANYSDPDISTRHVYQKLGIPKARVSELLHKKYHFSFKQIINRMRIEEAKRLLKQTDLRVTDISFKLGFNNITYFNYIFKEYTGLAPSEFKGINDHR